jgi:hypothetical protein
MYFFIDQPPKPPDSLLGMPPAFWSILQALVVAIVAAGLTLWVGRSNEAAQRRRDFKEKQLRELYTPLMMATREIKIINEDWQAATVAAVDLMHAAHNEGGGRLEYTAHLAKQAEAKAEHDNDFNRKNAGPRQIETFERLYSLLKENLHLAEPKTAEFMDKLIPFMGKNAEALA